MYTYVFSIVMSWLPSVCLARPGPFPTLVTTFGQQVGNPHVDVAKIVEKLASPCKFEGVWFFVWLLLPLRRLPAALLLLDLFADVSWLNMSEDCRTCAPQCLYLWFIETSWDREIWLVLTDNVMWVCWSGCTQRFGSAKYTLTLIGLTVQDAPALAVPARSPWRGMGKADSCWRSDALFRGEW